MRADTVSDLLLQTAQSQAADPKYQPNKGVTKCNIFARDLVQTVLGSTLPELAGDANQQYTQLVAATLSTTGSSATWLDLTDGTDWEKTYATAVGAAKGGQIVMAAWPDPGGVSPHGHVAVVMPLDTKPGYGSLNPPNGYDVPIVAQAGAVVSGCTDTGVEWNLKLSCAFGVAKQPNIRFFQRL